MADTQGGGTSRHGWEETRPLVRNVCISSSPRQSLTSGKFAVVLAASLFLAAAALLLKRSGGLQSPSTVRVRSRLARIDQLVAAEQEVKRHCPGYAYLEFTQVLHQNLGQQGPDQGDEGIVIGAKALMTDGTTYKVLIIINATSNYTCNLWSTNAISGQFGVLYVTSGQEVALRFTFKDATTGKTMKINDLALSFFNLDTAAGVAGVKSLSTFDNGEGYLSTPSHVSAFPLVPTGTMFAGTKERPLDVKPEDDYPQDPLHLTLEQQQRAVTIVYEQAENIHLKLNVGKGVSEWNSSEAFFYSTRPSIKCAKTLPDGQSPPFPDLGCFPPLDKAVVAGEAELFEDWFVEDGEIVEAGRILCTTLKPDQSPKKYVSPQEGRVTIQGHLKRGDNWTRLSSSRILAVVSKATWPPLPTNPTDDVIRSPPGFTFKRFNVDVGASVSKGQEVVELLGPSDLPSKLTAPQAGVVTGRHGKFKDGDPVERSADRGLMVVGKFMSLRMRFGENDTLVQPDSTFKRWRKDVGQVVQKGDPVADIIDKSGTTMVVKARQDGKIKLRQEDLARGMKIDDVMLDKNLAVVGKFDPLQVGAGETAATVSPGMIFLRYFVQQHQALKENDTIAEVYAEGEKTNIRNVTSPRSGFILQIHKDLRPNMNLDQTLATLNMATIGKLRKLSVSMEQRPVKATSKNDTFQKWFVSEGGVVQKNDIVATIKNSSGGLVELKSPKYGTVEEMQPLKKGALISEVMMDRTLAVIGKFPKLDTGYSLWNEICCGGGRISGVVVSKRAVFADWVGWKEDSNVQKGQVVAQILITDAGRRRLEAEVDFHEDDEATEKVVTGFLKNVSAPEDGLMGKKQPLEFGMMIGEGQHGNVIATIKTRSSTFMQILAIAICVMMWLCVWAAWKILKKPKPILHKLLIDSDEDYPSEDCQQDYPTIPIEPEKKGVRLDFEDDHGEIRTVYAHYRPLGIIPGEHPPMEARNFTLNSYARVLHVQRGWKLVGIGEEIDQVEEFKRKDLEVVNHKLGKAMEHLPLHPLCISFRPSMDKQAPVVVHKFVDYPLGLEFANETPIKIKKVLKDCAAAKANDEERDEHRKIKPGWLIVGIGNMPVSLITDFKEVKYYLKEGLKPLADDKKKVMNQGSQLGERECTTERPLEVP